MSDIRRVGHIEVRDHLIVDVATDCDHAGLVQLQRRRTLAGRQNEFELPRRRKRVGVVAGVVAVVEDDLVARTEHFDVRYEGLVLLVDDVRRRRRRRRRRAAAGMDGHGDHRIDDRVAVRVTDAHAEFGGTSRR
jgi:hypothetical protein